MSGLWAVAGVPHAGWTCIGVQDLGEPLAVCDMCGKEEIRYVHRMEHEDYPRTLAVGCVCAGHMERDMTAPRARERRMKNVAARRRRWLSRRWSVSAKGNLYLEISGTVVVCFREKSGYRLKIGSKFGRLTYPDDRQARLGAFDYLFAKGLLDRRPVKFLDIDQ